MHSLISPEVDTFPLGPEIMAEFAHFIGRSIVDSALNGDTHPLLEYPSPTVTDESGDTQLNAAWLDLRLGQSLELKAHPKTGRQTYMIKRSPGKLMYDSDSGRFMAVDDDSCIGKIALLQQEASAFLAEHAETTSRSDAEIKAVKLLESKMRRAMVDITNGYATARFNGQREVVNGGDFRGSSLRHVASLDLLSARSELVRTTQQALEPSLFDRWNTNNATIRTPTMADKFLLDMAEEVVLRQTYLKQTGELLPISRGAEILEQILQMPASESQILLANIFYAGDMTKTFKNISAVAKMCGLPFPEDWQQFQGTTTEFRLLKRQIEEFESGVSGYLEAADRLYAGDMTKAFKNISAVAKMCGLPFPEDWQQFQGTTTEFRLCSAWVEQYRQKYPMATKSQAVADFSEHFGYKPNRGRINYGALVNMPLAA